MHRIVALIIMALLPTATMAGTEQPLVMATIGDSISAGFNAYYAGDNRQLSWATGDANEPEFRSHRQRLAEVLDREVVAINEAIVGSVIWELERQVKRIVRYRPAYVTINVGANDLCTWPTNYESQLDYYESTLRSYVDQVIAANNSVKILLAPIPNMYNLWEVAHDKPACQERWDAIDLCRDLMDPNNTEADRQRFVDRWDAANDALDRIAADYPDHIRFERELAYETFTWDEVAKLDCFHPSIKGQGRLAEMTWQHGWYP